MTLSTDELVELLRGDGELALIDIREVDEIRSGHLYHAAYLPTSWSDGRRAKVSELVPRRDTTVVLVGDEAQAQNEATRWASWGYSRVRVLAGGAEAWAATGHLLFSHLCVPSMALAETARELLGTPTMQPDALQAALRKPNPPLVVDVRTRAEYESGTVPGAIGLPGGEIVAALAGQGGEARPVVVTCADRTRAIFGAQSLRDAELPNVSFLEGGTNAWTAVGYELAPGEAFAAPASPDADHESRLAQRLAENAPVKRLSAAGLETLRADATRTTYIVDPRLEPGDVPLPGLPVIHAPAGQLVEAVDEFLPVLRARVVLIDQPPLLRALSIARWLLAYRQLDVYLLDLDHGTDEPSSPRQLPVTRLAAPTGAQLRLSASQDQASWSRVLPRLASAEPAGGFTL